MPKILVRGIIEQNGKYLLVQEAKEKCQGKWNIPAGHLEDNETIIEGTKREILEETGYTVDLTGLIQLSNKVTETDNWLSIIFSAKIINGSINYNKKEILDVAWYSLEELKNMQDCLRAKTLIIETLTKYENGNIVDINLLETITQ